MNRILLVTEANEHVASGHLFECIETCNYFISKNIESFLMVNRDMPPGLKSRINVTYFEYKEDIQQEKDFLVSFIREHEINKVMFNLRDIKNEFVLDIKKE